MSFYRATCRGQHFLISDLNESMTAFKRGEKARNTARERERMRRISGGPLKLWRPLLRAAKSLFE